MWHVINTWKVLAFKLLLWREKHKRTYRGLGIYSEETKPAYTKGIHIATFYHDTVHKHQAIDLCHTLIKKNLITTQWSFTQLENYENHIICRKTDEAEDHRAKLSKPDSQRLASPVVSHVECKGNKKTTNIKGWLLGMWTGKDRTVLRGRTERPQTGWTRSTHTSCMYGNVTMKALFCTIIIT